MADAESMPVLTALQVAVRELRRRRESIQRRGLMRRDISTLEALRRSMPDA